MWKRLLLETKSRLPQRATWGTFSAMISARWQQRPIKTRFSGWLRHPVRRAFAISLGFHCFVFGAVEIGNRAGWWRHSLFSISSLADRASQHRGQEKDSRSAREVPIVFVEVDPAQAVAEPPEQAKYYSSHSSRAANRDLQTESDLPKIAGTQDKVPKTLEHGRPEPAPLQPAPVTETQPEPPQPQPPPPPEIQREPEPGNLAMAKSADAKINREPTETQSPRTPPPPQRREPRRLANVQMAHAGSLGEKMKQQGGVRRYSVEGLDVKATPFGSYDAAIVEAIRQRWYDLLEQPGRDFVRNESGKVVLTFRLNSDGTVTRVNVAENEVSFILSLLCQRAVEDPAPFAPWPNDMRRLIGVDHREVRFTFHYN